MKRCVFTVVIVTLFACGSWAGADSTETMDNWPAWRGPLVNGVAPHADPPVKWSATENIKWKLDLPGQSNATPIIWGDRVFVVTAAESERTVDGWLVRERRWLERRPLRVNKTVHVLDAKSLELVDRYEERVRLFDRAELSRMFSRAGFAIEASYGGYRAEGFSAERSRRMILRLRREVGSVDPR